MSENKQMVNALIILLQTAVQKLGPIENNEGEAIKKIIAENNLSKIILTGAWLERCLSEGMWVNKDD